MEAVAQNSCLVSVSVGPQASALIAIATQQVVFITTLFCDDSHSIKACLCSGLLG